MPYKAPHFEGQIHDQLVIHADGTVEVDGVMAGWIERLEMTPVSHYRAGEPTWHEIRFDMAVVRVKPEPDAVYDLGGRLVGYSTPTGFMPAGGRRGRLAVADDLLRQVGDIVRADPFGAPNKAVQSQLFTSARNASRWIAAARERGFLT